MLKKVSAESEQNRNDLKQNIAEKFMNKDGILRILKRNTTECRFFVLHYLRLEKHALNFSSENVTFQQFKT
jgi:hypothetical protein